MIDHDDLLQQMHDSWSDEERAEYEAARPEVELALHIAELVYDARTDAGLTQAELARRMGVSQSHISTIEGGGTIPSLATLARVAKAVGRRLDVSIPAA